MKQYQVEARSPSKSATITDQTYLDEAEATKRAAELARSYNAARYQGTNDWEAWVLIQKHQAV